MALSSLTFRQNLHRHLAGIPLAIFPRPSSSSPLISHGCIPFVQSSTSPPQQQWWSHFLQSRSFKSSPVSQWSSRSIISSKDDEIGPDTILFEGCDYNHWLIVMDFPKDNKPPPEEMIRTYEETCAKGLGISVEEAKKKMYACSTTTYTGFQVVMTEEESEKFNGLPGVIFVLPDSYIDPQNKEYGGDKYIDGTIIPRPPPVQHGRQAGRFRDRNRFPDQPRYDRQGAQVPNQQGNPNYGQQQGRMQEGGRNYGPPQTYASPQQNYSPHSQNYASPGQNYGPPGQNYSPPQQQNYGPPQKQNYGPSQQQSYGPPGQNYASPQQQNYNPPGQMGRRDSMPMNSGGGRDSYQSVRGGPMPPYQGDHNQGGQGYFPQGDQRSNAHDLQEGFIRDNRNFGPAQGSPYGQGAGGYSGQATPEPVQGPNWTNKA